MDQLDEVRWRAVERREAQMTGLFVYAVRTTGVFCSPGCASRRPLRRHVEFFATPDRAIAAGYRACRRCLPERGLATAASTAAVVAVCRQLEDPVGEHAVAVLARDLAYSERHLRRRFAEVVGVTIAAYGRAQRAVRARESLRAGSTVSDAAADAGYGSMRGFYEHAAAQLGMTPGRYRDGGRGEDIRFTSIATPLGVVVAARTSRGVCAVRLGPDEDTLMVELTEEFARATLTRDDEGLADVARVLARAVRGEGDAPALPLDVESTAFQARVWEALRAIPSGETRTYSQVAAQIGAPRAVRAVASACAANRVALSVPCHRVVRADGSLGGYRWGVGVKEALLAAERDAASAARAASDGARTPVT